MKIVFRCDASQQLGSGHVRRCLNLADELKQQYYVTKFVSRRLPGNLFTEVVKRGHAMYPLPEPSVDMGKFRNAKCSSDLTINEYRDAEQTLEILSLEKPDWLVVDHYGLGRKWEKRMRSVSEKILVIEDLVDRSHDCDLLLNHSILPNLNSQYRELVGSDAGLLLGPRYTLLSPQYSLSRVKSAKQFEKIDRVFVSYGNTDPTNETSKALNALAMFRSGEFLIDVVVGKDNPNRSEIEEIGSQMENLTFYLQPSNMANIMACADLSLSAGGMTIWEQMALGVPAIVTTTHNSQVASTKFLDSQGYLSWIGSNENASVEKMYERIRFVCSQPRLRKEQSERGKRLVDGKGIKRVRDKLKLV